ncbi:hypothetical protein J4233_04495 [Candidatus Pacearchaeota archaeon]|nr:hypothetical protein [Candidatus Pacearchaeota archaeon]
MATGLVVNSGCGITLRKTPNIPFETCANRYEERGVRIGVEPFETKQETEKDWYWEIVPRGFVPVYVCVQSDPNSFSPVDIHATEARFVGSDGTQWSYVLPLEMTAKFNRKVDAGNVAVAVAGSLLLPGFGLGFAIGAAIGDAQLKAIERNFVEKTFRENFEVAPGGESRGFVIMGRDGIEQGAPAKFSYGGTEGGTFYLPIGLDGKVEEVEFVFGPEGNVYDRIGKK